METVGTLLTNSRTHPEEANETYRRRVGSTGSMTDGRMDGGTDGGKDGRADGGMDERTDTPC